jgi:hypothetical protein
MRPFGRGSYSVDGEPNPVSALRVDHEHLAIEIQQHIYARTSIPPTHRHKVIIY